MELELKIIVTKVKDNKNGHYIGRFNYRYNLKASSLANPYKMNNEDQRQIVVDKYRDWLWAKIKTKDKAVCSELDLLANKVRNGETLYLVCWCSPLLCHGNIIKNCLLWMLAQNITLLSNKV